MKQFIKEKYNILIPVFLGVVILIALFLYGREYRNNRYAYEKEQDVYQYFSKNKIEYKATISRNRKDVVLDIKSKDFNVSLDSTPIYIKDSDKVIFPKEMSAVFPIKDRQYAVNALTEIYKKNDLYYINQKEINIKDISIKKQKSGRYVVDVYTDICDNLDGTSCEIKRIGKILNKAFDDKFIIQNQECGLRENKTKCKFTYMLQDKYNIQIGVAKTTKADSPISGDSNLQTKLEDGKYLLALSDGMGSGPEARKSSKIAIKMLERLLEAGFDKDISIKLINSTLIANLEEDMYATLDVAILDLYKGNLEFIKNGACPTFIKRGKEIQILKSLELPTGIVENMDLVVYDYDLQPDDLIVMCTDGVIESNTEYISKELWIKYLLEDMQTTDAQKIADIILSEAIDNNYGKQKDDMTVIVAKIGRF